MHSQYIMLMNNLFYRKEGNILEHPLNYQVSKRREEMYNFYYKGIGDRIKKRRLELKYTQALLAKGICSNTYVSKIENNRVVPNREQLMLIMEKMDMNMSEIGMPEQIVDYLDQSVRYFFFKDIESYEILFKKVQTLEFSSLVYIIRLGYFVLTENYEDAKIYYEEVTRYYNSLEDYGFATFLIYGSFYNIAVNDYKRARYILDLVKGRLRNDEMLYGLYSFLNYVTYGFLNLANSAQIFLGIAKDIFLREGNTKRSIEILMYMNIFRIYEGTTEGIRFNKSQLSFLARKQKNFYLFVLSMNSNSEEEFIELMDKDCVIYYKAVFFKAIKYIKNENNEKFLKMKKILLENASKDLFELDYIGLLKFYESKNSSMIKENLISHVLPYIIKKQNIYMIRLITLELERIFSEKNRYKDALKYGQKCRSVIKKLQTPIQE